MNATLAELKLVPDQPSEPRALWEAIRRLDHMVVNNTVEVSPSLGGANTPDQSSGTGTRLEPDQIDRNQTGTRPVGLHLFLTSWLLQVHSLVEDVEVTSGSIQLLRQDLRSLVKQINQTARTSQVQFMETGLEVEAAREVVLRRVAELAGNLSQQSERLQEMDVDVDYLYTTLYKDNSSSDCGCKPLRAALARLERGVANVTELANRNRLALEGAAQWGGASEWEPAVEVIQQDLQQVPEQSVDGGRGQSGKHLVSD